MARYFKKSKNTFNVKKIIPLVIAGVLLIVAIVLFVNNLGKGNDKKYTKVVVNYNNETKEYELTDLRNIEIGEIDFLVNSIEPNRIIITTSLEVTVNDQKVDSKKEIEVYGDKKYKVCITSDDCFQIEYSR